MKNLITLLLTLSFSSLGFAKCLTHEDNEGTLFRVENVVQEKIWTTQIDAKTLEMLLGFDAKLWDLVLEASNAKEYVRENITPEEALNEYFDDIEVVWIKTLIGPKKILLRFDLGVGGGNGLFLVIEQNLKGNASYKLMSKTLDGDVEYCAPELQIKD